MNIEKIIEKLSLQPHPEGGYYTRCYESRERTVSGYPVSTSIYYLLNKNDRSQFHRLKHDELWFHHLGSPLKIHHIDSEGNYFEVILGSNIEAGEVPQYIVPAGIIFSAQNCDTTSSSLCSCVVSPGFDFKDFELFSREMIEEMYPQLKEKLLDFFQGEQK